MFACGCLLLDNIYLQVRGDSASDGVGDNGQICCSAVADLSKSGITHKSKINLIHQVYNRIVLVNTLMSFINDGCMRQLIIQTCERLYAVEHIQLYIAVRTIWNDYGL